MSLLTEYADTCIWPPFTQVKTAHTPLRVKSGKGATLTLEDGKEIIDCISSWWVNLHGHSHPVIAKAIYEQALQLEHVIFAGCLHEPALQLAERLIDHLPDPLSKVFYTDNGSTAVEVALKQAYQYWRNLGQPNRCRFICFEGGYHGDTIGAMSLGSRSIFNDVFQDLLFDVDFVPFPDHPSKEAEAIRHIQQLLEQSPSPYAAVMIEPLVQGAGGMRMCRSEFLQQLKQTVKEHECLLIFDEVMTGFGRTGELFACLKAEATPDIITLSKGITGGFLPLAVTVCTDRIYQAFYSDDTLKTLFHSHSYTANPLGCAAGLASLNLLEDDPQCYRGMEQRHLHYIDQLKQHPKLENIRLCGTIIAMDVKTSEETGYLNQMSKVLYKSFIKHGLLIRPLGNVIYLLPPYCITDDQLDLIYSTILQVLEEV